MSLLLISSSRTHGTGFLEHCRAAIADHFDGIDRILFIPYALADWNGYEKTVQAALQPIGIDVVSIHHAADAVTAVQESRGVFIGGGNSFRLLKRLSDLRLLQPLKDGVQRRSLRYMGSSAGTNMACPTIRTTNDMPIVEPPSLSALGLIPFQINPHYLDPDPGSTHKGETREQRLQEYLEENSVPVLGLREGCWLKVDGVRCRLEGTNRARLFRRGETPQEFDAPADLDFLL